MKNMSKIVFSLLVLMSGSSMINAFDAAATEKLAKFLTDLQNNQNLRNDPNRFTKIKELVEQGADPNIQSQTGPGNTAISLALFVNPPQTELIKVLKRAGANINFENRDGATPLTLASGNGAIEKIRLLLSEGANPNTVTGPLDNNPLMNAIRFIGSDAHAVIVVKDLIDGGANVNITDSRGETPLMTAVKWEKPKVVELLLSSGADPLIKETAQGLTALDMARVNRFNNIVKIFEEFQKKKL